MKLRIYLLSALVIFSMLFTIQVKADNNRNNNNDKNSKNNNNDCNNNNTDTNLPIDSGIVFLAVAGTAIGIFAVKKARSASKIAGVKP